MRSFHYTLQLTGTQCIRTTRHACSPFIRSTKFLKDGYRNTNGCSNILACILLSIAFLKCRLRMFIPPSDCWFSTKQCLGASAQDHHGEGETKEDQDSEKELDAVRIDGGKSQLFNQIQTWVSQWVVVKLLWRLQRHLVIFPVMINLTFLGLSGREFWPVGSLAPSSARLSWTSLYG